MKIDDLNLAALLAVSIQNVKHRGLDRSDWHKGHICFACLTGAKLLLLEFEKQNLELRRNET